MARFFHFHEQQELPLPPFYPRKVYPLVVLWRFLQGDSAYWGSAPSEQNRAELQRRLAQFWRQSQQVNRKSAQLLEEARRASDLRDDAREDVEHMERCRQVGERFAGLLAAYHDLLASGAGREAVLAQVGDLTAYLRRSFRFDFTDPKGGDQSSWLEALEGIRSQVLQR